MSLFFHDYIDFLFMVLPIFKGTDSLNGNNVKA